jgi:tetratricopeptide (TPR) repeat protein
VEAQLVHSDRELRLMKKPDTEDDLRELHNILRDDPNRYLQIVNEWIANDPSDASAYFDRHYAWKRLEKLDLALSDINKSIELEPDPIAFLSRAQVYRQIGDHEKALEDYSRIEREDPVLWRENWLGLLYQADSYAHLGNLGDALRCWELLPNDFWTPGMNDAPPGNKMEIQEELLRISAAARENMT